MTHLSEFMFILSALLKMIEKETSSGSADQSLKACIISQPELAGSDDSGVRKEERLIMLFCSVINTVLATNSELDY